LPTLSAPRRRLIAMGWFAGFALLAVSVFFYPLHMAVSGRVLYIALPTAAGGISGFALGGGILDGSKAYGYRRAALRGIGVSVTAFAVFSGLFAISLPMVERGWSMSQSGGLFANALVFGFLMGGPLVIVAGGLAGASLLWLGRRL
jgi:hypothetical protein